MSYHKINQLYVYVYPLFCEFPSHLVTTEHGVEFSEVYSRFSLVIYFIHSSVCVCVCV